MLLHNQYEFNPATDLIAKGGFAEVYLAYDRNLNKKVAIKRFVKDAGTAGSVIKEIQKSIDLNHPNIIRYFNCFTQEYKDHLGRTITEEYGVMEYANAGHLGDIIEGRRMVSESQFREIIAGIQAGLQYLHSQEPPVIHRDLKPSNILLVEKNGQLIAKIADFGISKATGSGTITATATGMLGTIEYMAPEQLDMNKYGINGQLTPAVDLWALGCIIFEYYTGTAPFGKQTQGSTPPQIIHKILYTEPSEKQLDKIPEAHRALVKGYLRKGAGERGLYNKQPIIAQGEEIKPDKKNEPRKPISGMEIFYTVSLALALIALAFSLILIMDGTLGNH
jgi:serine/threonine protein kinase